jgi:starch phosphorylase
MYYARGEDRLPYEWVHRMKQCLLNVSPQFNCQRMVGEYMTELYEPAHLAFQEVRNNGFEEAKRKAKWSAEVQNAWDRVKFIEVGPGPNGSVVSGAAIPMRATVDLAGLTPEDVRVEAVLGRVGVSGQLEGTEVMTLPAVEQRGSAYVFEKKFVPQQTGRLGYALRISSNHFINPLTRPCSSLLKWGQD